MMYDPRPAVIFPAFWAMGVMLLALVLALRPYASYLREHWLRHVLWALLASWALVWHRFSIQPYVLPGTSSYGFGQPNIIVAMIELGARYSAAGLLAWFAWPLAVRLYRLAVGTAAPATQTNQGPAGIRDALQPGNIVCAIGVSLTAWLAYDYSIFAGLLVAGLCLALPAMMLYLHGPAAGQGVKPATPVAEDLTDERQRVLRLLEDGRVTAEEAAELLNSMGGTVRSPLQPQTTISSGRRFLLIGAALVLVGFFLPWFSFNLGREMQRAGAQIQGMMPSGGGVPIDHEFLAKFPSSMNMPMPGPMNFNVSTGDTYVTGGEVGRGMGWMVLVLAVGAALLPYVAVGAPTNVIRVLTLVALGASIVVVLFLLTNGFRNISVGLPIVTAGLVLESIGALRDYRIPTMPAAPPALA